MHRAFSVISIATALFCGICVTASSAETIRVGKSNDISFTFIPLDVGIHEGIFQKNGVDIEPFVFGGTSKIHQAMIAGSIDIALAAGTDIPLLMKGAPEIGVGAIAVTPALFGLVIRYDSPIHSLADMKGKSIGVSTVASLSQWIAFQVAKKEGWPRDAIKVIAIGGGAAENISALKTNQVDAVVSASALGWNLEERKEGRLLVPVSDFIGPFLLNVTYATNNLAEHHPGALRGFLKGWYEAVAFMASHKAETVALAQPITHFSRQVQEKQYDEVMPSMSRDGTFPQAAVARTAKSFVDLGLLPKEPDMSKYLTTRFLPQR